MRHASRGKENMSPVALDMSPKRTPPAGDQELCGSPGRDGLTGYPIKEETVYITRTTPGGKRIRVPVILKVYVSNFGGRYAVVSQDRTLCRDSGYINLRHCVIKSSDNIEPALSEKLQNDTPFSPRSTQSSQFWFQIVSQKIDGQSLSFTVPTRAALEQWLSVLSDPEQDLTESLSPKVIIGSPIRRCMLGDFSSSKLASPRLAKKQCQILMPALEEEE